MTTTYRRDRRVSTEAPAPQDSALSRTISVILVAGVALSAVVLVIGLGLLALSGQTGYAGPLNASEILGREGSITFPRTLATVWQGVITLRPFAVIELGLLLLIATPILRVAASAVLFLYELDILYTVVAFALLALLLVSNFLV